MGFEENIDNFVNSIDEKFEVNFITKIGIKPGNKNAFFIEMSKNVEPFEAIRMYEKFLNKMKGKLKEVILGDVYSPYEAFIKILKIKNRERICADFFSYFDPDKFKYEEIIKIVYIAKNSGLDNLLLIEFKNLVIIPCVNVFLNSKSLSVKQKQTIIKLVKNIMGVDLGGRPVRCCSDNDGSYFYHHPIKYEDVYNFSQITRFYIYKLRNLLEECFESQDIFKNIRILKFPYLE